MLHHSLRPYLVLSILLQSALACESEMSSVGLETAALDYAGTPAAGSPAVAPPRTATLDADSARAPAELVATVHDDPAGPDVLTGPQQTAQVSVSWSCDNGSGGTNSGTCDVEGIISAKKCVNTIKANCPKKTVRVSW